MATVRQDRRAEPTHSMKSDMGGWWDVRVTEYVRPGICNVIVVSHDPKSKRPPD